MGAGLYIALQALQKDALARPRRVAVPFLETVDNPKVPDHARVQPTIASLTLLVLNGSLGNHVDRLPCSLLEVAAAAGSPK